MAAMSSVSVQKIEPFIKKNGTTLCKELIEVALHGDIGSIMLSKISQDLAAKPIKDNDSRSMAKKLTDIALHGELNPNLLSRVGEYLAIEALEEYGFKNIIPIEESRPSQRSIGDKIKYGSVTAVWEGKKYVIEIKTRMKFDGKGTLNPRYNYVHKNNVRDLVKVNVPDQEKARIFFSMIGNFYNAIPAWIAVSIDNTQERSVYWIFFETSEKIKWNLGIPMKKRKDLDVYRRLAENRKVTDFIQPTYCDILLIAPLKEEFDLLEPAFHTSYHDEKNDVIYYYDTKYSKSIYKIDCIFLGKTGPMHAAAKTLHAMLYSQPRLVVLIGMGGALDDDLLLGDVVVGDEINLYYADAKAFDEKGKYIFRYSGRHWPTKTTITELVEHFPSTSSKLFAEWQKKVNNYRTKLNLDETNIKLTHEFPVLTLGRIASGDIVGASESFSAEMLDSIDRKLKVLEMEAAGVAEACKEREVEMDFIIIRGISDFADSRKKQMDDTQQGAFRRMAMYSATHFFLSLIQSQDFQKNYPPTSNIQYSE